MIYINTYESWTREGTKYFIYLKNDKSKSISKSFGVSNEDIITYTNRLNLTNILLKSGLKEYNDFIFMIVPETKGKDWIRLQGIFNILQYFNWVL